MDNSSNQSSQSRFIVAAVLSLVILFAWSYFFTPHRPAGDANANTASTGNATPQQPTVQPTPASQPLPTPSAADLKAAAPDTTPGRTLTIRSPLYEVKLDSKGGLASSWIIIRNKSPKGDFLVYADGSTDSDRKPLQLISDEALKPRELPFRLSTDDQALTDLVNTRNYQISVDADTVELTGDQEQAVDMTLTDPSGVSVKKSFIFRANSFVADLGVTLTRDGQAVPNTKLLIGASLGDQAINHHNYYHIESEAVAAVAGDVKRHQGASFTFDANGLATLTDNGQVDWAGVADSYFAMVAIPRAPAASVEYRASKYDVQTQPYYDSIYRWVIRDTKSTETRHLITAYVPITADGTSTKIFTGTKDYFLLSHLSSSLTADLGRPVEITNLINFSNFWWLRWLTKPLSIPILYALNFFHGLTHNYGVAIIIFTILFYSLLFPLRWSQSRSFKKASGNAPKMKAIQDKIKDLQKKGVPNDDPRMRELQMDQLKMTKDALPIGGCLPMVLQFPLLLAFYTAVTVSLEVRQATFIWLPDLSAADPWHVLEFAFALSMVLSMKFTPQAATVTSEQQMQQRMMTYFMPVMMLWVMWSAPSGLLLYWFSGNLVSFGQQMIINRMNKPKTPGGTEIVDAVPSGAKKVKPKLSTT